MSSSLTSDFDFSGTAEEIYRRYTSAHDSLREELERDVSVWKWANGAMYDPRPFGLLLSFSSGEWQPEKTGAIPFSYGLTADGTVLVERRYAVVNGVDIVRGDTFYFRSDGRMVSLTFGSKYDGLMSVAVTRLESDGTVAGYSTFSANPHISSLDEEYEYVDGILQGSTSIQVNFGKVRKWNCMYEYDPQGRLAKVSGSFSDSGARVLYQRPPDGHADLKTAAVIDAQEALYEAANRTIARFAEEHAGEDWYAFTFIASLEGTEVSCAFATEQGLDIVAAEYLQSGYEAKSGDSARVIREALRWSNPEDGWFEYALEDPEDFEALLSVAFCSHVFELFDGTTETLCMDTLRRLDASGAFGEAADRASIAVGFTHGEEPSDFMRSANEVNPPEVVARLKQQYERAEAARMEFVPD